MDFAWVQNRLKPSHCGNSVKGKYIIHQGPQIFQTLGQTLKQRSFFPPKPGFLMQGHNNFLSDQLTLFQPGRQIMPNILLLTPGFLALNSIHFCKSNKYMLPKKGEKCQAITYPRDVKSNFNNMCIFGEVKQLLMTSLLPSRSDI